MAAWAAECESCERERGGVVSGAVIPNCDRVVGRVGDVECGAAAAGADLLADTVYAAA